MASRSALAVSTFLCLAALAALSAHAADPEEIRDFAPPADYAPPNASYFTFTELRNIDVKQGQFANVTNVNVVSFPVLSGLGVANALLVYPPGSVNVPHTHPRGTETLFVLEGTLEVGLIDTTLPVPVLFTQTLYKNDIFVFPRGLVHFQINKSKYVVRAYASFSSTNPGLVSLPRTLFGVHIDPEVLTKSFEVSSDIIAKLSAVQP
ncbi:protein MpPR15l [Marchantia polymorpha subsp. ruderalis]|uniref:Germin-like protein n=2 Tax=Marchantia polymorpha TaxID=3197 RepID=A0AAF6BU87_MARPO|nr:hypothetical protein MARPO_0045s0001 [Marchantia polymorpha]BBN15571.1 hypothetical protein Mp_6g20640 [Marchantia polymorpha subsp. ruderalis]|eukprot:PTQ39318.1 hypothetical protein MARPO_0045s0001 [Marchantia polymorpha]